MAELNRIGIPTGILIAPLMPGINDGPGQVERIVALAEEAGATSIGGQALFLRGATRDVFFDWLRAKRPGPASSATSGCTAAARTCPRARAGSSSRGCRRGGAAGGRWSRAFDRPPPALAPPKRPEPARQTTLF